MKQVEAKFAFVLAACLWIVHADVSAQPRYTVTRIAPDPLKGSAKGIALNDVGDVVGEYCPLPVGRCQPFVFHEGRLELIELAVPDSIYARASLITNHGLVAGTYQTEGRSAPTRGASFLYKDGRLNPFQPPWPLDGFHILGLDNRGDAFGISSSSSEQAKAYLYLGGELRMIKSDDFGLARPRALNQAGQIATLGFKSEDPDSVQIESVAALNNHGHVVGQAGVNVGGRFKGFQAFVAKEGHVEILDVRRDESNATDINDAGTIVGFRHNHSLLTPYPGAGTRRSAFLWIGGKTYSLDQIAGRTIDRESALRINQRGQILVNAQRQAYLLTPASR